MSNRQREPYPPDPDAPAEDGWQVVQHQPRRRAVRQSERLRSQQLHNRRAHAPAPAPAHAHASSPAAPRSHPHSQPAALSTQHTRTRRTACSPAPAPTPSPSHNQQVPAPTAHTALERPAAATEHSAHIPSHEQHTCAHAHTRATNPSLHAHAAVAAAGPAAPSLGPDTSEAPSTAAPAVAPAATPSEAATHNPVPPPPPRARADAAESHANAAQAATPPANTQHAPPTGVHAPHYAPISPQPPHSTPPRAPTYLAPTTSAPPSHGHHRSPISYSLPAQDAAAVHEQLQTPPTQQASQPTCPSNPATATLTFSLTAHAPTMGDTYCTQPADALRASFLAGVNLYATTIGLGADLAEQAQVSAEFRHFGKADPRGRWGMYFLHLRLPAASASSLSASLTQPGALGGIEMVSPDEGADSVLAALHEQPGSNSYTALSVLHFPIPAANPAIMCKALQRQPEATVYYVGRVSANPHGGLCLQHMHCSSPSNTANTAPPPPPQASNPFPPTCAPPSPSLPHHTAVRPATHWPWSLGPPP